jgi:sterol desaturase/sphingolipid hydroxylase (fatty acid hydroxylase superfamily)
VLESVIETIRFIARVVWLVGEPLFWSALAFGLLAVVVKGREALEAARRAATETRITLLLYVFDLFLIGPPLGLAIALIVRTVDHYSLAVVSDEAWSSMSIPVVLLVTVFVGDFFSYWRHRLEHTPWLWPAHAIHHSDTEVSWLTGNRFHPINRLVTAIVDNTLLALLGAPAWAIMANELIRHYYGEFVHADLPWTYGRTGAIFVSPAMHRWHHARDVTGSGSNFATVFSVFDRAFGTLYVPGPCKVALGVTDEMGPGAGGQLAYPFKCWVGDKLRRPRWVRALRLRRTASTAPSCALNAEAKTGARPPASFLEATD